MASYSSLTRALRNCAHRGIVNQKIGLLEMAAQFRTPARHGHRLFIAICVIHGYPCVGWFPSHQRICQVVSNLNFCHLITNDTLKECQWFRAFYPISLKRRRQFPPHPTCDYFKKSSQIVFNLSATTLSTLYRNSVTKISLNTKSILTSPNINRLNLIRHRNKPHTQRTFFIRSTSFPQQITQ